MIPYILGPTEKAPVVQGSDEWLLLRRKALSSTDIASAIPKTGEQKRTITTFIKTKNSETVDLTNNVAVQMGKDLEPVIMQNFIHKKFHLNDLLLPDFDIDSFVPSEVFTRTITFKAGEYTNLLLSSHDGSIKDKDGNLYVIEVKYSTAEYNYKDGYVLPRYLKQIAHHLLVNEAAVGCFLVVSDNDKRVNISYFERDHPSIKGIMDAICSLATSITCSEPEPDVIYWTECKTDVELRNEYMSVAREYAKIHHEARHMIDKEEALKTTLKTIPYSANCSARFPEYQLEVRVETVTMKKLAEDRYVTALEELLKQNHIGLPNKASFIFNMSYPVVKLVQLK